MSTPVRLCCGLKMRTPPQRSGVTFEVGAQLEARDQQKNWYSATIEKIDFDSERVLIHYRQWSRRHDEWFSWNSPYLRPLERISLRRRGLNQPRPQPLFGSGSKVLACWTDCRFYPAKILRVNKDDSYTVRFYDGVVRTVKPTKVKPFQKKARPERSTVDDEGWEEGESEEEGREKEKIMSEEERKRKLEPSSSHPPAKKKTEDTPPGSSRAQIQPITADPATPNPAHSDRDVLLERQVHLPTTHKFSREPLYRVIKNQPPPILSIELDHNPFKCPAPGCSKSFRKSSLLFYHIKYYHSDQQEALSRKQSSSGGGAFLSVKRNENQNTSTCHHDNREHGAMETEVKKEKAADRKEKNFLRIKLKKKKKKKKKKCQSGLGSRHHHTHTQADDGSDWSTLTAESGEDTPPWPLTVETGECEVVRCVCEVDEENDFMIQCEACWCWQHGTCMGLYEDSVPHRYTCYYCRDAAGWRQAQHVLSQPDLLISGHMFGLSCVLSGLQLKISLLHSPSQPDLQLWRLPWKREEGPRLTGSQKGEAVVCYISSEHCYQKPGASWENVEESRKDKQTAGATLEDDPEQKDVKSADVRKHTDTHTHLEPRPLCVSHCQLNLLDHVEYFHRQVSTRMDVIERELDVLESWLDHSGELEPPDPLSRLPQLKQRIRRLLRDLVIVRNLSVCR
ncbi:hypothetical protein LDENG_00215890 [Lucifuga dentata]|nr:hypothetical protein LDENG_00215890 [Lucifuga dentata]